MNCKRTGHVDVSCSLDVQYNTALLLSANTTALEMFCGAKYTPHAFTPIIKEHLNYYNSKHRGENSLTSKYMRNATDIKLYISYQNCLFTRSTA